MANLQSQIDILAKAIVNEHVERTNDQSKLIGNIKIADVYNQMLINGEDKKEYNDLEQSTVTKYNNNGGGLKKLLKLKYIVH